MAVVGCGTVHVLTKGLEVRHSSECSSNLSSSGCDTRYSHACDGVSSSPIPRVALVLSPHTCLLGYGLVLPRARGERLLYMCGVNVSWPSGESSV